VNLSSAENFSELEERIVNKTIRNWRAILHFTQMNGSEALDFTLAGLIQDLCFLTEVDEGYQPRSEDIRALANLIRGNDERIREGRRRLLNGILDRINVDG
jgi:hypothetical protein